MGGGLWMLHPPVPPAPHHPSSPGPCSGGTAAPASWGSSKGREKAAAPTLCEGLGLGPRSLQSFRAVNGFLHSEFANEPAWEAAGGEGPQIGEAERGRQLLLA